MSGHARRDLTTKNYHKLRAQLYAFLLAVDGIVMALALAAANLIRFGDPLSEPGIRTWVVLFPIYAVVAIYNRAFSIEALTWPRRSALRSMSAMAFALVLMALLLFALKVGADFSRLVFGIGSVLSVFGMATSRFLVGRAIGPRLNWTFRRDILLADEVDVRPRNSEILVSAAENQLAPNLDDPAMLDRLSNVIGECDRVILACPDDRRAAWSEMLKGANVDVEILAPDLRDIGALELRSLDGRTTLLVACGPIGMRDRAVKRTLDLAIAVPALMVLAVPMVLIALLIRIGSRGPALFRQPRMGHGNSMFQMLKFRTMRVENEDRDGVQSTSRDDARITRIGSFLRRTSIDELPQLINVLRGEMSIVGPRPHALGSTAEDEAFWEIDRRYWDRHAIKPGITGLAQVRGLRGTTERREDLRDRLQADLEYLAGWSLGRDLLIIARTAMVLVHRRAY
ncbi:exopolysaccharide biosynthesis polyprenyl glycosylphosphotransferase [Parasphingopyxis sp. CP4]|uniref:exopolysaccharide biosynthesis polyprenyl glycosylphosphotransferase n=1 Tax=Parasphingopyxis sp. CP4 TaxID=2724527 RepID=UPI0015A3834E|nr:exopolysaccharide biosynthesis polyprenyl glycosylphosphotransferase [Parasphingopyxis sp. CP4]QLC22459.1 exopolysaccharide biosynthesis polyprenyl glycosylphosphotransferase [Parasphingopyxis sp. CP4]